MSSSSSSKCVRVTFLVAISWRESPGGSALSNRPYLGWKGAITSPLALSRVVCSTSPVPQEAWVFHTRSVGGLGLLPAPEAQI